MGTATWSSQNLLCSSFMRGQVIIVHRSYNLWRLASSKRVKTNCHAVVGIRCSKTPILEEADRVREMKVLLGLIRTKSHLSIHNFLQQVYEVKSALREGRSLLKGGGKLNNVSLRFSTCNQGTLSWCHILAKRPDTPSPPLCSGPWLKVIGSHMRQSIEVLIYY